MQITRGIQKRPQKVVIYGPEGIGKTQLAAQFPEPLFMDFEGGTSQIDVMRTPKAKSYDEIIEQITWVVDNPACCKTLVVDTADWCEQLAQASLLESRDMKSIEDFGYGKGYVYLAEKFSGILKALDRALEAGVTVVVTAHAKMRKFEQPDEIGSYDRWEMKLTRNSAPLLKEWADMVLFCNFQTFVINADGNKKKAQGGKRVIYTTHHPCWDAKNRHNLPERINLDYSEIKHIFEDAPQKTSPIFKIRQMMEEAEVTESQICKAVGKKKKELAGIESLEEFEDNILENFVIVHFNKLVKMIKEDK